MEFLNTKLRKFVLGNNFFKSTPSCRCHQSAVFEIPASVHIQLGPVTGLSSRRQSLCKSPVRKLLEGAVNPSEAGHLPPLSDVEHELRILQTDYRLGDFVYIMKMKNLGFDDYMCLKIAHARGSFAPSIKIIK